MRRCKTCVYYSRGPGFDPSVCHYDPQQPHTPPDGWCRHWSLLLERTLLEQAIGKLEWALKDTTIIELGHDAVVDALNILTEVRDAG